MKCHRKLLPAILAAAVLVSSVQFPAMPVWAEELVENAAVTATEPETDTAEMEQVENDVAEMEEPENADTATEGQPGEEPALAEEEMEKEAMEPEGVGQFGGLSPEEDGIAALSVEPEAQGGDWIIPDYSDRYVENSAMRQATKEALSVVKPGMNDLQKMIALHDYLVINCEYDKKNADAGTIPWQSDEAYGALVKRTAVCGGYALAYQYLLNIVGIKCYEVIGYVNSSPKLHAWNLVELDGKWYHTDVTWDDPTPDSLGEVSHAYMLKSDADMVKNRGHLPGWQVYGEAGENYSA
ncbi:MAG: hypothetical protein NC307_13775 [Roseburia sp.]|nr:hypothetical protein [Roseburia sp.]